MRTARLYNIGQLFVFVLVLILVSVAVSPDCLLLSSWWLRSLSSWWLWGLLHWNLSLNNDWLHDNLWLLLLLLWRRRRNTLNSLTLGTVSKIVAERIGSWGATEENAANCVQHRRSNRHVGTWSSFALEFDILQADFTKRVDDHRVRIFRSQKISSNLIIGLPKGWVRQQGEGRSLKAGGNGKHETGHHEASVEVAHTDIHRAGESGDSSKNGRQQSAKLSRSKGRIVLLASKVIVVSNTFTVSSTSVEKSGDLVAKNANVGGNCGIERWTFSPVRRVSIRIIDCSKRKKEEWSRNLVRLSTVLLRRRQSRRNIMLLLEKRGDIVWHSQEKNSQFLFTKIEMMIPMTPKRITKPLEIQNGKRHIGERQDEGEFDSSSLKR